MPPPSSVCCARSRARRRRQASQSQSISPRAQHEERHLHLPVAWRVDGVQASDARVQLSVVLDDAMDEQEDALRPHALRCYDLSKLVEKADFFISHAWHDAGARRWRCCASSSACRRWWAALCSLPAARGLHAASRPRLQLVRAVLPALGALPAADLDAARRCSDCLSQLASCRTIAPRGAHTDGHLARSLLPLQDTPRRSTRACRPSRVPVQVMMVAFVSPAYFERLGVHELACWCELHKDA